MDRSYWWRKFETPTTIMEWLINGPSGLVIMILMLVLGPFFYVVYILDQRFDRWHKKREARKWEWAKLHAEVGVIENENRLRRKA